MEHLHDISETKILELSNKLSSGKLPTFFDKNRKRLLMADSSSDCCIKCLTLYIRTTEKIILIITKDNNLLAIKLLLNSKCLQKIMAILIKRIVNHLINIDTFKLILSYHKINYQFLDHSCILHYGKRLNDANYYNNAILFACGCDHIEITKLLINHNLIYKLQKFDISWITIDNNQIINLLKWSRDMLIINYERYTNDELLSELSKIQHLLPEIPHLLPEIQITNKFISIYPSNVVLKWHILNKRLRIKKVISELIYHIYLIKIVLNMYANKYKLIDDITHYIFYKLFY
jgi:hypothetical protein